MAVTELLPSVAVTVASWLPGIDAAAAARKVAVVVRAATVTDEGTLSEPLLLATATLVPPTGAGWESITVQMPEALWPGLGGLHAMPDIRSCGQRLTAAVCTLPPSVAVIVAL